MSETEVTKVLVEVARLGQELKSFRDELMGREGNPGRLVNVEHAQQLLSAQLSDTVREALAPVSSTLKNHDRRIGTVEGFRKWMLGAIATLTGLGALVIGILKLAR